jgi:hypothetical protein
MQINLTDHKNGVLCVLLYKSVEVVTKGSNVQEAIKNAHAEWLNHYWELFMEGRKIETAK